MVWTNDGPPDHWSQNVKFPKPTDEEVRKKSGEESQKSMMINEESKKGNNLMNIQRSTFESVAKALQENFFMHSTGRENNMEAGQTENQRNKSVNVSKDNEIQNQENQRKSLIIKETKDNLSMSKDMKEALLEELTPEVPATGIEKLVKLASGTIAVAKETSKIPSKIGAVSVVGSIAGGMAGLVIAGPAGAVFGATCGKMAGVLGIVIEGSVTVGVLVAGAAAGSFTAKQIQQQAEQRIIAIGASGSTRKVLLVRPKVWIDPAWEKICQDAKRNTPVFKPGLFSIFSNDPAKEVHNAKKERYHRDSDIVSTAEFELPTNEKILLLVSRILNDKLSPPGHVYRALIKEHRKRSSERTMADISDTIAKMEALTMSGEVKEEIEIEAPFIRSRRLDAHAIIKHVTATLLEVRPGLASSPLLTDMSATAVEGLVFGELYHSIFEEILEETKTIDKDLMAKITSFDTDILDWGDISQEALNTLGLIPGAHTPVDKLWYAVSFLEHVSNHFTFSKRKAVSADSLLKMVCLHLVVANVPYMNAEILFLEEFARDERLLRGKEGYALVTLQASLHFL
eukprot:CAMPEP_0194194914 /NCGR_PEP_ID=MMETSP0154-20130528/75845_1 /TAXON_ID=1049557 /ORGANISM="Thalassiothrix antarctica, Strain L6-D1" /LENGTH=569 /DNA_ID=CAMNT_0038919387 /DNA_START=497 /DNA_END=2203 /DNA_ORIENTATION=+